MRRLVALTVVLGAILWWLRDVIMVADAPPYPWDEYDGNMGYDSGFTDMRMRG